MGHCFTLQVIRGGDMVVGEKYFPGKRRIALTQTVGWNASARCSTATTAPRSTTSTRSATTRSSSGTPRTRSAAAWTAATWSSRAAGGSSTFSTSATTAPCRFAQDFTRWLWDPLLDFIWKFYRLTNHVSAMSILPCSHMVNSNPPGSRTIQKVNKSLPQVATVSLYKAVSFLYETRLVNINRKNTINHWKTLNGIIGLMTIIRISEGTSRLASERRTRSGLPARVAASLATAESAGWIE